MSFWETVKGNHLADVLMHTLPDIAEVLQEKRVEREQYVKKVAHGFLEDYITTEIELGRRYVDAIPVGNHFLVVMEKDKKK